jgi:probable F420-dependent oxidoreductase
MEFGVGMFATDYAIAPQELAREAESRGFESLWLPEHTHIPVSRRTPYPGGGDLPKEYWHTHDLFVALTAAAVVTTKIKIASGICLVIERDPIIMAKEVASIDLLSGGRFIFGIGGGWNAEEMENHGTDPKKRWRILRERVLAMEEIWTKDEAEFHGEFVNFDKIWSYPKPVQKPYPAVIMGGSGPTTLNRVVEFCDGWIPVGLPLNMVVERIPTLNRMAEEAGRDPKTLTVSIFNAKADPESVARMQSAGIARAVFMLPAAGREIVLPLLDNYAKLATNAG